MRFSTKIDFYLAYEIEPWLLWNVIGGGSTRSTPMTLSDPEGQDLRGQLLQADLLNNSRTDQIRQDISVREGGAYFYRLAMHYRKGAGPNAPHFWGSFCL